MLFTDCRVSYVGESKSTIFLVFTFSQLDIHSLLIYDGCKQHVLRVNSVEHSGRTQHNMIHGLDWHRMEH